MYSCGNQSLAATRCRSSWRATTCSGSSASHLRSPAATEQADPGREGGDGGLMARPTSARTSLTVVALGFALTISPLAPTLGFTPLPWQFYAALAAFAITYLVLVEVAKRIFYAEPIQLFGAPHRTRGTAHRIHRRAARFSHPRSIPVTVRSGSARSGISENTGWPRRRRLSDDGMSFDSPRSGLIR
jgi:hypothetical protein